MFVKCILPSDLPLFLTFSVVVIFEPLQVLSADNTLAESVEGVLGVVANEEEDSALKTRMEATKENYSTTSNDPPVYAILNDLTKFAGKQFIHTELLSWQVLGVSSIIPTEYRGNFQEAFQGQRGRQGGGRRNFTCFLGLGIAT